MKKILMLFLLSFPIVIFTIVTLTSSVIGYYVPLGVEGVEVVKGSDISDTEIGNSNHQLEFRIFPANARDLSFEVLNENGLVIVSYNEGMEPLYNNLPGNIVSLSHENLIIENGLVKFKVKTENIGFTRLTLITKDGNFRANSDIMVLDKNADPSKIQGVVFDYNKTNEDYKFGNENDIIVGFTYFPKYAYFYDSEEEKELINESLRNDVNNLDFITSGLRTSNLLIIDDGRAQINIRTSVVGDTGKMSLSISNVEANTYIFNIYKGVNIYNQSDLFANATQGKNLFVLNYIDLRNKITFRNGVNLFGNNNVIDHSKLKEYDQKDSEGNPIKNVLAAITFIGNNSGLFDTHIVGALDENSLPYEHIINVRMDAQGSKDKLMFVNNVIIENGRYNLSVKGRVLVNDNNEYESVTFELDKIELIGAFFSSLELTSYDHVETMRIGTIVNLSRLKMSYTAIGVLIQNSRGGSASNELNLIDKEGIPAIKSTSWRNLDDASGALSANNFGYIMSELKGNAYKDVYYKEGKDFYVNPVIMIRGGHRNYSTLNYEETDLSMRDLILKQRVPKGAIEMGITGGSHPFSIYLMDPKYYKGDLE